MSNKNKNKTKNDDASNDPTVNPIDGSLGGGFAEHNDVVVGKEKCFKSDCDSKMKWKLESGGVSSPIWFLVERIHGRSRSQRTVKQRTKI